MTQKYVVSTLATGFRFFPTVSHYSITLLLLSSMAYSSQISANFIDFAHLQQQTNSMHQEKIITLASSLQNNREHQHSRFIRDLNKNIRKKLNQIFPSKKAETVPIQPQLDIINATKKDKNQQVLTDSFIAEFALAQGNVPAALETYQQLVQDYNQPNLNERALKTALEYSDIDTALQISKKWVQGYPNDVPALFYLAHLSLKAGEYQTAIRTLDQILAIDDQADLEGILAGIYPENAEERQALFHTLQQLNKKDNPSVLVMLAGLDAQNGDYQAALKKVDKALKRRPQMSSFIILKANLYFASKRPDLALAWLDKNTTTQKTPDVGLYEVQYLVKNNQHKQALAKLQKMLLTWKNHEQLLFLAGVTSIDLKQAKLAEQYLSQLIHSHRYQDEANYYLAINAERQKQFDKANRYYLATDGNLYTVARKNMAKLYQKQNRSDEMIRLLTQERVSHPHQASFLYQLQVQLLKQNNQIALANQLLDEAIQQMPENTELIYEQVLILDPLLEQEKIQQRLDELLIIEPQNPVFLNAYAYTLARQNRDLDTAKKYAEQALADAPDQPAILDTLGYIAFLQNDFIRAIQYFEQAFSLNPSLTTGTRYAQALYMHGDHQRFAHILAELSKKYPQDKEVNQLKQLLLQSNLQDFSLQSESEGKPE